MDRFGFLKDSWPCSDAFFFSSPPFYTLLYWVQLPISLFGLVKAPIFGNDAKLYTLHYSPFLNVTLRQYYYTCTNPFESPFIPICGVFCPTNPHHSTFFEVLDRQHCAADSRFVAFVGALSAACLLNVVGSELVRVARRNW